MLKSILHSLGLRIENEDSQSVPPLGDPNGLFAQSAVASEEYWRDMHAPPSRRIIGNARELGADPSPGRR